jgi:hypothetical protein
MRGLLEFPEAFNFWILPSETAAIFSGKSYIWKDKDRP